VVTPIDDEKRAAARAAAQLVEPGMTVGLGTGSTVAYLLPALAERELGVRYVSTSPATATAGLALGLDIVEFSGIARLDLAIDGADQVAPDGWLIKGGGGAHTREKIVATAADRFVVIVSSDKVVAHLVPPVPLELLAFGLAATLERLTPTTLRKVAPSPDGGVIADWGGPLTDPVEAAAIFGATAGVVDHGLFPPELVADVLIARGDDVEHRVVSGRRQ
jgi:ribose 5-phosphate isomerase A